MVLPKNAFLFGWFPRYSPPDCVDNQHARILFPQCYQWVASNSVLTQLEIQVKVPTAARQPWGPREDVVMSNNTQTDWNDPVARALLVLVESARAAAAVTESVRAQAEALAEERGVPVAQPKCPACGGTGREPLAFNLEPGALSREVEDRPCPKCEGTGTVHE
jgi:hypothetical protein